MSNVKSLSVAAAAALIGSLALTSVAGASPFASTDLGQGYMQVGDEKPAEGKCGEGKCGAAKGKEGSCGEKGKEKSCGGMA